LKAKVIFFRHLFTNDYKTYNQRKVNIKKLLKEIEICNHNKFFHSLYMLFIKGIKLAVRGMTLWITYNPSKQIENV
jgi:hypothetical protein